MDLNFARRLEMAETLTPNHVPALQRFAPEATSETLRAVRRCLAAAPTPPTIFVGMGLYGLVTSADIDRGEELYRS